MRRSSCCLLMFLLVVLPAVAEERRELVDLQMLTRIREEGFNNSQVMDTAGYLCDVIGPRLTGSPNYKRAHEWTKERLESWGLSDVHLESWDFGRGWHLQHLSVHMVSPDSTPLLAVAKAWTPGTNGAVRGKVMKVKLDSEADLANYKGKVAGMILFVGDAVELKPHDKAGLVRYSEEGLKELAQFQVRPRRGPIAERGEFAKRMALARALEKFLGEEKVLLTVSPALLDAGAMKLVRAPSFRGSETAKAPSLLMSAEHYNRVVRLLDRKIDVELEVDMRAAFVDDAKGYNTVGDLPGADLKEEVVLAGGHLDSWHPGTGATDDAAGVSVAMEAVRILKALKVQPRRTIRVGLWGGEEQGFLGSRAYVSEHLASRPEPRDAAEREMPAFMRGAQGPLALKAGHAKFSGYFNLDNGTGRIRGIYAQGNAAVVPIFEAWLKPVADLGATTVTMRNTGGTDHQPFDSVGLPGFQFIQDEVEYGSLTWHSNMDVFDRLQADDLMQASVVMAWFAYNAAMRDELLPRKPIPQAPPARRE